MRKGRVLRLAGFVTAACATTALVATAAQSTGAWFTSSQSGTLSANSGHLNLDICDSSGANCDPAAHDVSVNFADVMPGSANRQTDKINYKIDVSSGSTDLWLVFNTSQNETVNGVTDTAYDWFTGGKGTPANGGLGGYGFFQVADSNGGQAFVSGNLAFPDSTNTPNTGTASSTACHVDAGTNRGGSATIVADDGSNNNAVPWCGVPSVIRLASGLANTASGTVSVTFGLDGFKQQQQNQQEPSVPFQLVATQHGAPAPVAP